MYFTEFLLLMGSAIVITMLLMYLGAKTMLLITPKGIGPFIIMLGSLTFTFALLSIVSFGFNMKINMNYFMIASAIIVLNKYWFGHFEKTKRQEEMKALPTRMEKVVE
ncbi:hypothetical protein [Sporosarcina ureilytica]|uniref:Uncharacterized protein n=1 Tax=Sporosarcina ureilytica TaxID=298596 RepID=A0A1D8JIN4_9BACL|nr:hypothetical protein [Sporosarcina ureilytica]AOV08579.1 hypothetical protein BI350_14250 [Sporosarcina ureilytica]